MQPRRKSVAIIVVETVLFKLHAKLQEVAVTFATDARLLSLWSIKGISTEIILKKPYTQINAKLRDLTIRDLNPESVHKEVFMKLTFCQSLMLM